MPRLYHTKSKTGCTRCRARRVKCDEAHPVCGGCERHKVDCVYDRYDQKATASPASDGTSDSPRKSHVTEFFEESRERRYRELRLLHFYTVTICPTLPGTCFPNVLETWKTDAPRLAFTYEPLLHSILSLSVHGLRRLGSAQEAFIEDLPTCRARYLEATLQNHRKGVASLSPETADAVCLASCVLAIEAFADLHERPLEPYRPPMEWLQLCRGVRGVVGSVKDQVRDNPNSKVKVMVEYGNALVSASTADPESNRASFRYLLDTLDEKTKASQEGEAYDHTVGYIGSIWAAQQEGQHVLMMARRLLVFSILAHGRFVDLVSAYDPRALVILAHFFAVALPSRQLWWIGHSPSREILAIDSYLGSGWRHEMVWPMEMAQNYG